MRTEYKSAKDHSSKSERMEEDGRHNTSAKSDRRSEKSQARTSRITERALPPTLSYIGTQDIKPSTEFLNERSLPEKSSVGP